MQFTNWPRRDTTRRVRTLLVVAAVSLVLAVSALPSNSVAQDILDAPLERGSVIEIARRQAPSFQRAELGIRWREAELVGAEQWSTKNPTLQLQGGPRISSPGVTADVGVSGWVPIPAFFDRARNIETARAGMTSTKQDVELARLHAVARALDQYVRVLHAKERLNLAKERSTLGEALLEIAKKREQAGDASQLDIALASAEAAAGEASVFAARAKLHGAMQNLALALGFAALEAESVHGSLADQHVLPKAESASVNDLIAVALESHPRLLAADASLKRTQAARKSSSLGWLPQVSLGAGYAFEENAHVPTLGIKTTIPIFERRQADVARGHVAVDVATREKELLRLEARAGVLKAIRIHADTVAAAEILEKKALGAAVKASHLAGLSYAAGKSELGAVLLVRRNTLLIRAEYLARQLDAALAANHVGLVVGTLGNEANLKREIP
ncbi:MAG: TolC family protein [Deltaproteobacteria bacterium]|nr:TolC family protein [Deltaproteobacteria bacterium]